MEQKLTLKKMDFLCESLMNWSPEDVEKRFHGTRKEILAALNDCNVLDVELFFSGFFCENPIVEMAAGGQSDITKLSNNDKIQVFIRQGLALCYLTNHKPGLVVRPYWKDKNNS